jgi:hypothetical protein
MSRITGSEAKGLLEAYSAVYAPQELTEEQIWEEVENWVNSLLEEGYDLSDYTWEEMYENYLNEFSIRDVTAGMRQNINKAASTVSDIAGSGLRGYAGKTTTSTNPVSRLANAATRSVRDAAAGLITGKGSTPETKSSKSALDGRVSSTDPNKLSKDAAADLKNRYPQSPSRNSGGGAGGGNPPITPAAQKVRPTQPSSSQTGDKAKDMDTWAKANPKLAAAAAERARTRGTSATTNPLMADLKSRLPAPKPATPSQATASAPSTSPTASGSVAPTTAALAATPKPTPMAPRQTAREKVLNQSYEYDAYDLVLEYLLNTEQVSTIDEAHYVMMEMDAQMIQDIVEEQKATWDAGQKLKDPRAQKVYDQLTKTKTKLPPA